MARWLYEPSRCIIALSLEKSFKIRVRLSFLRTPCVRGGDVLKESSFNNKKMQQGSTSERLIRVGSMIIIFGFFLLFTILPRSFSFGDFFLVVGSGIVLSIAIYLLLNRYKSGFKAKLLKILLFGSIMYSISRGTNILIFIFDPVYGPNPLLSLYTITLGAVISFIGLIIPKKYSKKGFDNKT